MANKSKALYLTGRTMSALRSGDALSGRMNRVVDRYLEWLGSDRAQVYQSFGALELEALTLAWSGTDVRQVAASQMKDELISGLDAHQSLAERIDGLTFGEVVVLIEILEDKLDIKRTAPSHQPVDA